MKVKLSYVDISYVLLGVPDYKRGADFSVASDVAHKILDTSPTSDFTYMELCGASNELKRLSDTLCQPGHGENELILEVQQKCNDAFLWIQHCIDEMVVRNYPIWKEQHNLT